MPGSIASQAPGVITLSRSGEFRMCTDIMVWNPNDHRVSARNLDYSEPMSNWIGLIPAGTAFEGIPGVPVATAAVGPPALQWITKHNYVTMITMPSRILGLPMPVLFADFPPQLK